MGNTMPTVHKTILSQETIIKRTFTIIFDKFVSEISHMTLKLCEVHDFIFIKMFQNLGKLCFVNKTVGMVANR